MQAEHKRQLRILLALALVWTLGCVHWYVCGIKGFCPAPAPATALHG